MFFNAEDDDGDFMSPGGSNKLASIFGMDKSGGQGANESLTYTAPKQPKRKDTVTESAPPAVLVASVVTAYKYVDNNYASQGKLGAALLGNHASKDYRILLYINKQQQVTNAKVTPSFAFNVQQNNYATFYDDARQTWSILFDTSDNVVKFAKEIALAKANSGSSGPTELISQELAPGEGGGLEQGDSVEVKYVGWLYSQGTLGKIFDQSKGDTLFRFKIGKGKVIKGWDQGMVGMKKGGKRLLVIPPGLAYGAQGIADRIPPNSTLVFEVQVVRVKLQKGEATSEQVPVPSPAPVAVPPSSTDESSDVDDTTIKGRTKSINEQLQHSTGGKSKLISRMARMGQPMLPFQGAVPAGPEESDEEVHQQPPSPKPSLPAKPRSNSSASSSSSQPHPLAQQSHAGTAAASSLGLASTPSATAANNIVMVGGQPMTVDPVTGALQPATAQPQPAFLQNLPGAQQLAVYQNPNMLAQHQQQQQQAALLQQQQLQQQQLLQQQQQQQMLGQGLAYGADSGLAPALLSESRQQNTEVRITLGKMSDKVDKILDKIEQQNNQQVAMMAGGGITPYGSNLPAPNMEANVLMQNIVRIVQENERLKKEVYDQSNKVQELNFKMSTLLEKNQKFVEQSQSALEERNEGYKHTASQSQARVLALEQEKVSLATELSSASSQISSLQLELAELRRREGELKHKLHDTTSTSSNTKEEMERLKNQREEDEQKIASLTENVREQKQTRKSLESKLSNYTEELADLKGNVETLEKNLSDRKRKAAEERRKLEEDMEDAKISYETTIESLREKLRKQKKSVDVETESKVSQIEEEISKEWQVKCDKLIAAANTKHERQMEEAKEEKDALLGKVNQLEKKVESVRSSGSSTEQQVSQLQDELADMKVWKEKYDKLRVQASSMKDRYEERLADLEREKEQAEADQGSEKETSKLREKIAELQGQIQQLKQQLSAADANKVEVEGSQQRGAGDVDVATEVKKIMNSVFQNLRGQFDAEESYPGSEVLATILNVIKETTIKLVQGKQETTEDNEEESDEDDEEEESEDNEESENEEETLRSAPDTTVDVIKKEIDLDETPAVESSNAANQSQPQPNPTDIKEETRHGNSQSSEGTSSDFEMVSENGIAQELGAGGEGTVKGVKKESDNNKDDDNKVDDGIKTPVKTEEEEVTEPEVGLEQHLDEDDGKQIPSVEPPSIPDETSNNSSVKEEQKVKPSSDISDILPGDASAASIKREEQVTKGSGEAEADSREPPPLFDDDEDDQDSPLFGKDDTVSDTFGVDFTPKPRTESKVSVKSTNKVDLLNDEDSKPQPPPPLFGDDSDDDDLDWLS